MFIKSMKLVNTIYTPGIDHISGPNPDLSKAKAEIRKDLEDLESILEDFKTSRDEEMKQFTTTFTEILKEDLSPFLENDMLPIEPELRASDHDGILKSADSSKHSELTSIIKKIFFDDLLFYHYDFLYKKAPKFVKMKSIVDRKIKQIIEGLTYIRKKIEFSKEELDIDSFVKLGKIKFNVLFAFMEKLVEIFTDTLEIEADQIREIFILNSNGYWSFSNKSNPYGVYSLTHLFLKKYNKTMTDFDESYLVFNSEKYFSEGKESSGRFENKYLSYLNLNITREYNKHCSSSEDTRFSTYRKYEEMIDSCEACKKCCEDMMKNKYCEPHRDVLKRIRSEYFANVGDSLFKSVGSIGWDIYL